MRTRILTTSRRVLGTLLLFLTIMGVVFGYLALAEYRHTIASVRDRVSLRSQLVAAHAAWLVSAGRQTLEATGQLAAQIKVAPPQDMVDNIKAILKPLPGTARLTLTVLDVKVLLSTDPDVTSRHPVNVSDILAHPADQPHISAMTSSDNGEEQFFILSKRLESGGNITGIANLYLPVSELLSLWASADLGPDSTIGLLRDDGWMVARYPPPKAPSNLSSYVLFTDYLKKESFGVYDAVSPVDNRKRVVGYRRVPNIPLVAVASADQGFAMSAFWRYLSGVAVMLTGLLVFCGLAVRWAWNLLREDEARNVKLAELSEHRGLLLSEIHHRIKNNLQAVTSLINLQRMDPEVQRDMTSRIAAMSAVHEQAYLLGQFAELNLRSYLESLVRSIRRVYGNDVTIDCDLADMTVSRDTALPVGVIANEVIANAMKHAFKGQQAPQVRLATAILASDRAMITISDNGVGFAPDKEEKGMGSRLISAFAQQIDGEYNFDFSNGTVFTLTFKR
ncbi:MAG: hypothetical protein JNM45_16470 [Rhizobiales bacterium]|nr:hypothetical protein [Hyphomicrobiales bacterium]